MLGAFLDHIDQAFFSDSEEPFWTCCLLCNPFSQNALVFRTWSSLNRELWRMERSTSLHGFAMFLNLTHSQWGDAERNKNNEPSSSLNVFSNWENRINWSFLQGEGWSASLQHTILPHSSSKIGTAPYPHHTSLDKGFSKLAETIMEVLWPPNSGSLGSLE